MKAKLLKKIRKIYTFKYVGDFYYLLNNKTQQAKKYNSAMSLMEHIAHTYLGIVSGFEYTARVFKRRSRLKYFELKNK